MCLHGDQMSTSHNRNLSTAIIYSKTEKNSHKETI